MVTACICVGSLSVVCTQQVYAKHVGNADVTKGLVKVKVVCTAVD